METPKRRDKAEKAKNEEKEEPICSNELLAAIREQMARRRSGPAESRPKDLKIEEPRN